MSKFMVNNACCKDGTGNGDPEAQDCLDKWKEQLEEVCNQYNEAGAQTSKDKETYVNSLGWETKLKNWNDLIVKTDEKAKTVVTELDFLLEQVKIVCEKSACTNEALEKLACLVKTIFDCFFTYSSSKEGLKDKISDFKKAVECLQSVGDEEKAEVLKCIEDYEQKITLVCEMQDEVLTKLIETLTCANLLYAAICKEGGLKDKLEDMREDLNGADPDDEDCDPDDDDSGSSPDPNKYPCDDKEAKPVPEFPISEGAYYKGLQEGLEKATEKTGSLKEDWIVSKKYSDSILSKKTSISEAIKAAEAAESGK